MTSKQKRSLAEKTRRRFTHDAAELAFRRGKTSYWYRDAGHLIHFVHLHLLSFAPAFRIHLGIRVLNDTFAAVALNGPSTPDHESPSFERSPDECSQRLADFCRTVGEPWFAEWSDEALVSSSHSPLEESARGALARALSGRISESAVLVSRGLVGAV